MSIGFPEAGVNKSFELSGLGVGTLTLVLYESSTYYKSVSHLSSSYIDSFQSGLAGTFLIL